ncbi:MAG: hypothetical protein P4L31_06685 [Candidatus Babeliales bacterium]|nr:hypothetical protein [Candidatus Babeliales bacterium]
MKNKTLILLCFISALPLCASEPASKEQLGLVVSAAIQGVPVMDKQGAALDRINLEGDEGLTSESYQELIDGYENAGKSFVLARAQSVDAKGRNYFHYYDAISLTNWVWGDNFWVKPIGSPKKNPNNNLPVINVSYFIYKKHGQGGPRFEYLGLNQDLFAANPSLIQACLQSWIYRFKKSPKDVLNVGIAISHDKRRFIVAKEFFNQANQVEAPLDVQRRAQLELGMMYYLGGNGVAQDFIQAIKFLDQANQVDAPLDVQRRSQLALGMIYRHGGKGVAENFVGAERFFNEANQADAPIYVQRYAQLWLGSMYRLGGNGVTQSLSKARRFLKQAIQAGAPIDVKKQAQKLLEKIQSKNQCAIQ